MELIRKISFLFLRFALGWLLWLEWISIFKKAADLTDRKAFKPVSGFLARKDGLIRFYDRVFIPGSRFPSTKDLAVSAGFEFSFHGFPFKDDRVIIFARHLRNGLINSFCFKFHNLFFSGAKKSTNEYWVCPQDYSEKLAQEVNFLVKDELGLKRRFFETYGSKPAEDTFVVYLPNKAGSVHISDGLKVEVNFNSWEGLERGFYRQGYEYAFKRSKTEIFSLQYAYRGNKNREYGYFGFGERPKTNIFGPNSLWVN